jgi:hypothetical protein
MGSSLSKVLAGGDYDKRIYESNNVNSALDFPLFEKAYGQVSMRYDLENNTFRSKMLRVFRRLHCWELALEVEEETENESYEEEDSDISFSYSMTLATSPESPIEPLGGEVDDREIKYADD